MQRKAIAVLSGLIIVACLWFVWMRMHPSLGKADPAMLITSCDVLAGQAIQTAHGGAIVVVGFDPEQQPTSKERAEVFRKAVSKAGGPVVTAEFVKLDPNIDGTLGCPSTELQEVVQKHGDAAVIVFLMELPYWQRVSGFLNKPMATKLIAVDMGTRAIKARYGGYFAYGYMAALLISKPEPINNPPPARSSQEQFDQSFQIITPQNYETRAE